MRIEGVGIVLACFLLCCACGRTEDKGVAPKARKATTTLIKKTIATDDPKLLSDYAFFKGELKDLTPTERVFPYAINTPLFSNYAEKARFIYLPQGESMDFTANGPFDFDPGAILIKNFFYHAIEGDIASPRRIIETRLLIKEEKGWKPLNYIWNEQQTNADLNYVGKNIAVSWEDAQGENKHVNYVVPNLNQCKNCHSSDNNIIPIGITAAQLNQRYTALQQEINQLDYFKQAGILTNFSSAAVYKPMPVWNDVLNASIEDRAKAYLDANCAHCHSAQGSAKNSGLYLNYHQKDQRKRGVLKPPIAAGKGSGDFKYDIVPCHPEESIFVYRMSSNDPAIRMPEIGRSIVHEEGLALLTQYIKDLKQKD
jgi:uncharacterized repeat protein (TIGR03806 family)